MHLNLIEFKSFYSLKVLFVKLLCGTTYIQNNKLIIQNTHNLISALAKNKQQQMVQIKGFISKITIAKMQIFFSAGVQNNAYQTAIICGYFYSISSALAGYLISKNNYINIYQDIDPQYNKDALEITIKSIVEISLLDVFLALISSKIKSKEKYSGK